MPRSRRLDGTATIEGVSQRRARRSLARQLLLDRLGYPGVAGDIPRPGGARLIDLAEGRGGQAKSDAVEAVDGHGFRIRMHGATLVPVWRPVEVCCWFVPRDSHIKLEFRAAR